MHTRKTGSTAEGLITTVGNNDLMRNLGTSQFLNTAEKRKKGNNLQAKGNPERQLVQGPVKVHADVKK